MPINFKPDVTIAGLRQGQRGSGEIVRVAGRAFRTDGKSFDLVDGDERIRVALAPDEGHAPPQAGWVGLQGQWDWRRGELREARIQFLQQARLNPAKALECGLPEGRFVADPERLAAIRTRARLLSWVRSFLEERGFLAVQTPLLRAAAEVAFLRQNETRSIDGRRLYLRTDPEEYLKRYLTAGLESVYEISVNVRGERPDPDRLQEFASVECYKRFWSFEEALSMSCELVVGALRTLRGSTVTLLHGQTVELSPPVAIRTFSDLVWDCAGLQLHAGPDPEDLAGAIRRRGWWNGTGGPLDQFRRTWLEWLLNHRVIPSLGQPTFIVDFPIELGLSYRQQPERPALCFRGELILPGGFELCHVYENLTDPGLLRARYEARLQYRTAAGLPSVDLDEGLFGSAALGMPPMAGLAVGLDRLLLLVLGHGIVGEGLLFPREGFAELD